MPRYFSDEHLRRLRNEISWTILLENWGGLTSNATDNWRSSAPVATSMFRRLILARIWAAASTA